MNERWKWIAPTLASLPKGARTGTGRAQQLPDNISPAGFRHPEPGCLEISLHLVHDRVSWNHYSMNDYFLSIIRGRYGARYRNTEMVAHMSLCRLPQPDLVTWDQLGAGNREDCA